MVYARYTGTGRNNRLSKAMNLVLKLSLNANNKTHSPRRCDDVGTRIHEMCVLYRLIRFFLTCVKIQNKLVFI